MRIKKVLPFLILLALAFAAYMYYFREGFLTPPTMTCTCPSGYRAADSSNSSKCYKCSTGTLSGSSCTSGGILDVKYKNCTCSNNKTPTCSDGQKTVNNKCYNCDPSNPSYNTPTLMTNSTYANTIRCTISGSTTATSKPAYEVANGFYCPT